MTTIEYSRRFITLGLLLALGNATSAQTLNPDDVEQAQAPVVGKVMFVRGDVRIFDAGGNSRPAKQGDFIQPGERVVTGGGALGQVKMTDGSRIGIRPGSELGFKKPAGALAGAPNVIELLGGDVRVLNRKFDKQSNPTEYILQTPDGIVQLKQADSLATLRRDSGTTGAATQTRVRLSVGNAVVSNKAGKSETLKSNQIASITPSEVTKQTSRGLTTIAPTVSTRAKTVQDELGQKVALASPLDSTVKSTAPALRPLPPLSLPGGTGVTAFVGYDVSDKSIAFAPRSKRTEDKLTPNLMANQVMKPAVSTPAAISVLSDEPPKVIIPSGSLPTGISAKTFASTIVGPVVTGGKKTLAPTSKFIPKLDPKIVISK